ncbi:hypothetical protein [Halopiger goleimassiliensis]|uniref:hypothetical protein n=1 Tax=Halopiger goleimassiliensis TaxID=1293048 RepID=UPI000677E946|nr:hypothetical protein [Halopiger goleimassiliensis]
MCTQTVSELESEYRSNPSIELIERFAETLGTAATDGFAATEYDGSLPRMYGDEPLVRAKQCQERLWELYESHPDVEAVATALVEVQQEAIRAYCRMERRDQGLLREALQSLGELGDDGVDGVDEALEDVAEPIVERYTSFDPETYIDEDELWPTPETLRGIITVLEDLEEANDGAALEEAIDALREHEERVRTAREEAEPRFPRINEATVFVASLFGTPMLVNFWIIWSLEGHGPLFALYNLVILENLSFGYRVAQLAGAAVFVAHIGFLFYVVD